MGEAGLKEGAVHLIRPDAYVAYANDSQETAGIENFFEKTGLRRIPVAA